MFFPRNDIIGGSTIESLNSARVNLNHLFFSFISPTKILFKVERTMRECLIRVKFKNRAFTKTGPEQNLFFFFFPFLFSLFFTTRDTRKNPIIRVSPYKLFKKRHGSM